MSVYEKARELADAIVASEESLRMADALALADESGISENELNQAINDYNALINDAMEIVRLSTGTTKKCGDCRSVCKGE